ncbi:very short patch repair endonuclease [Luteococcus sanguinis]|uniref:Very short patch repair endonuclease n=1 Tax=Luteococcus sanguinis TaxID=174038 RepID=A0ABW1X116_9ACTN
MSEQKRAGTAPELALRRLLHAKGYRYRVGAKVPGMPRRTIDVAFTRKKLAVFVDGCFWHGCPEHCVSPKNNAEWWAAKLEANRARDSDTDAALASAGWRVVRIWEHETPADAVDRIEATLKDC